MKNKKKVGIDHALSTFIVGSVCINTFYKSRSSPFGSSILKLELFNKILFDPVPKGVLKILLAKHKISKVTVPCRLNRLFCLLWSDLRLL